MTRYSMALDTVTCIGCYACTLACKVENGTPAGIWWAPVIEKEIGTFPDVRRAFLPLLCNHCDDAPCIKACPTGAVSRRDDGIVMIDQDVCCGSRGCVIACPYGAIHYYEHADDLATPFAEAKVGRHQAGTAQKCSFCVDRLERGLDPACVVSCPTGTRIFGDLEDADSPLAQALESRESMPLAAPVDTAPSVRYLPEGVRRAGGAEADVALPYRRQRIWGPVHALEFWLLGAGAGVFTASRWLAPDRTVFGLDLGAALAAVLVAAAGLVLTADLGRPFRFARAVTNWRKSWISRGAIADFSFLALVALLALPVPTNLRSWITGLAVALGIVVAAYPGLAMGALRSVPAWRGRRLALEFVVEAAMSGVALTGLIGGWGGSVLPLLMVLALARIALAAWRLRPAPGPSGLAILGAGVTGGLATLALLVPAATLLLGAAASVAALATGLATKLANLRHGASPSPFGVAGELGGSVDAER